MLSPVAVAGCAINLIIASICLYVRHRRGGRDWLSPFALAHFGASVTYAILIPLPAGPTLTAFLSSPGSLIIDAGLALVSSAVLGGTVRLRFSRPHWRLIGILFAALMVSVLMAIPLWGFYGAFHFSLAMGWVIALGVGIVMLSGPTAFYRLAGLSWLMRNCMTLLLALASQTPEGQTWFITIGILNVIFISATGFCLILIELDDARLRAQEANLAKTQFIANMSHELRTPLNAILGFSELLEGRAFQPTPAQIRSYAGLIQEAGRHLLGIINALLDMASIEARRENLHVETVRIDDLIRSCIGMVAGDAGRKDITLAGSGCDLPLTCQTDPRALRQIVLNLLSNAVKFSPPESQIDIRLIHPDIAAVRPDIRVLVCDQGPGIAPADLARLFEPFWQAGETFTRAYGGVGLGLAIAQRLAQALGGTLAVESAHGKGSTFTIILPLSPPHHAATRPRNAVAAVVKQKAT